MEQVAAKTSIIGLHPVPFTEEFLRSFVMGFAPGEAKEAIPQYMDNNREEVQATMDGLHLIEVLTEVDADDFGKISQDEPTAPRSQVPYAERFLSPDGTELTAVAVPQSASNRAYRVAFILHFVDDRRPLYVPEASGKRVAIRLPNPTPLPDRLSRLFK
jgi:hypothetical protein